MVLVSWEVWIIDDNFSSVGGLRAILTDQNKLVVAVGGVIALAVGIYTTRCVKNISLAFSHLDFRVWSLLLFLAGP